MAALARRFFLSSSLFRMPKQIIQPAGLPDPGATRAYSHGVRAGNLLFLAGQTGTDAEARPGAGRFELQTRRIFERMQIILQAAGGSLDNLVTMTVFITDMRFGDEFVRLRGEILKRDFPASALIGVSHLANPEALLEIQAVAAL
jgi:2-iminobutanoate/2-iminopropanoate deaminase